MSWTEDVPGYLLAAGLGLGAGALLASRSRAPLARSDADRESYGEACARFAMRPLLAREPSHAEVGFVAQQAWYELGREGWAASSPSDLHYNPPLEASVRATKRAFRGGR